MWTSCNSQSRVSGLNGEVCPRDQADVPILHVCPCLRRWQEAKDKHMRAEWELEQVHNAEMTLQKSGRLAALGLLEMRDDDLR